MKDPLVASQNLWIPRWHPATTNALYSGHWAKRSRLKSTDREMVAGYARSRELENATGKRRVRLIIRMAKGRRRPDVDAFWKSLLDALTHAGLIKDDGPTWCEIMPVEFQRGDDEDDWGTTVILENME